MDAMSLARLNFDVYFPSEIIPLLCFSDPLECSLQARCAPNHLFLIGCYPTYTGICFHFSFLITGSEQTPHLRGVRVL